MECVPNFSEGRRTEVIKAIADEIRKVPGVRVLDVESDKDHNRMVVTFIGNLETCKKAAFNGISKATELIDLNLHKGEHPRIGATDVVPFVPISNATMKDCVILAKELGKEVAEKLHIPVYLYEEAATSPERRNLEKIRKGEYEGLKKEIETNPLRKPDFGHARLHPTAGATVIGARFPLIAYNVNLKTSDIEVAKKLAKIVRSKDGGLPHVKALAFELKNRGIVQVSMNLTNYTVTSIYKPFELIKEEAKKYGVEVIESEIVGVVPIDALADCISYYLKLQNFKSLQILEKGLLEKGDRLIDSTLNEFIEEVASDSPAPGGGSVSALAGALSAALIAMVCKITMRKTESSELKNEIGNAVDDIKNLIERLESLIDLDTEAYNKVLSACRLPKRTDDEKKLRNSAIQNAFSKAIEVPLETVELSAELLVRIKTLLEKIDPNVYSDIGTAAHLARSAAEGAILTAKINLKYLEDKNDANKIKMKLNEIKTKITSLTTEIDNILSFRMEKV